MSIVHSVSSPPTIMHSYTVSRVPQLRNFQMVRHCETQRTLPNSYITPHPYNHLHLLPTHPIYIRSIQSSKSHNSSFYFHWYHCPPFYLMISSSNCSLCNIFSTSKLPCSLLCAYLPPIVPHPVASHCAYVPLLIHPLVYQFYVSEAKKSWPVIIPI